MEYNFGKTKRVGMGIALALMLLQGVGAIGFALTPGEEPPMVAWSFVWLGVAATIFALLNQKKRTAALAGAVTALVCGCVQILSGMVSITQIASVAEELLSYGYGQNELNMTYATLLLSSVLSGALYILVFGLVLRGIKTGAPAYTQQTGGANRFDPQTGQALQQGADYIFCTKCGARNAAGATFCGSCGGKLGE